jgi:small subunit ribosomal protein S8
MSMTDPVSDLLTRIRNACQEQHEKVEIPASRLKANIVKVLKDEGYVRSFRLFRDDAGHPVLRVYPKYTDDGKSVIRKLRRISKPGLRQYSGYNAIRPVLNGAGIVVLSTSQGVMSGQKAKELRLGGEVLCEVW